MAMFRSDYRHLLQGRDGDSRFQQLRDHSFDAVEYLWNFLQKNRLDAADLFPAARFRLGAKLFYHSHCQQKTTGSAAATEALLRAAGFDVVTSRVECCGMAGSFGYKKEFYDLSMAVGQDLFQQVQQSEADGTRRVLVATGTSCQEQLHAGLQREVFYPTEVLAEIMTA